jgi:hypothetical protein
MIADEMIHGCVPRSGGGGQQPRGRSVQWVRRANGSQGPVPLNEQAGWGEWDASARVWKEVQARGEEANYTSGPACRTRIEEDTPIVPRGVAEQVCEEASLWLGEAFPREWVMELAEHANVVYQHNVRFRRLLRRDGDAGRDSLRAFMRHWLCGLLASRRPDLGQRLPESYAAGQDLAPCGLDGDRLAGNIQHSTSNIGP